MPVVDLGINFSKLFNIFDGAFPLVVTLIPILIFGFKAKRLFSS